MPFTMDYIKMPDGAHLAIRKWEKSNNFDKIILALHGLGVDGKGYGILSDGLTGKNLIISVDLRGHGDSDGIPGDIPKYWQYIDDINYVIKNIRHNYNNIPLYLLGESIGSICALNCSINKSNNVNGLILLAPALKTYIKPRIDDLIDLFKSYFFNSNLNIDSRYYKNQLKAKDDFCINCITPKFILNLWAMITRAYYVSFRYIKTPILILQGKKDNIVKLDAVINFYKKIRYNDKEIDILENGTHSLLANTVTQKESIIYIDKWMKKH